MATITDTRCASAACSLERNRNPAVYAAVQEQPPPNGVSKKLRTPRTSRIFVESSHRNQRETVCIDMKSLHISLDMFRHVGIHLKGTCVKNDVNNTFCQGVCESANVKEPE